MIVNAITPAYRTGGSVEGSVGFTLSGHGFLNIKSNQRAYVAVSNGAPTAYYGREELRYSLDIQVISDGVAECVFREGYNYGPYYLGAIGDGVELPVWINNSKPLP